ncbi:uncharacterized protein CC84DRAFT_524115 [Paraphaeosphaeria sporulosa]|uniref:Uncharacterized protein n=1 Tax=Paraphaeosphaeria sporulosa TaxID=1460663 RepID=A0A177CME9_9PLEO|nr:uncharacterized protein CC84DRAFT_524115 [Paraphaeosphaeria sporulosa]OAG07937.1 hypothetical protein CC84DRAFT_524115 [Paraphaeosphaeria sporulosa]
MIEHIKTDIVESRTLMISLMVACSRSDSFCRQWRSFIWYRYTMQPSGQLALDARAERGWLQAVTHSRRKILSDDPVSWLASSGGIAVSRCAEQPLPQQARGARNRLDRACEAATRPLYEEGKR